ncbi:MAG: BrnA antitoxin family protein [Steroidobacteraceae bacterium]
MRREYDFAQGRRGAVVRASSGKTRITIRLDNEVIEWFRRAVDEAGGGNYQSLINTALRGHIARQGESFETVLRRVVREELQRPVTRTGKRGRGSGRGAA